MSKRANNEGTVYRRGSDGLWVGAFQLPTGRRSVVYGKTAEQARAKLRTAQQQTDAGVLPGPARLTVEHWLNRWLKSTAIYKTRPRTFQRYEQIVRLHLVPNIGQKRMTLLAPGDIERLMAEGLASGQSPTSVTHWKAVLRNSLNAALRHGLLMRNVATLAEGPRIQAREVRALSVTDAQQVLACVRGDRLEALFTVALACGLRQSEALGLRWGDIDLDQNLLTVQRSLQRINGAFLFLDPKSKGSRRTIVLPGPVAQALRDHHTRQQIERTAVGPTWQGDTWGHLVFADGMGGPIMGFHATRRLAKLLSLSGLAPMRYHDLRHGATSLMAAQGVPVRIAMEILGHADIGTTMNIYAHIATELQRGAAASMAQALWGEPVNAVAT